MAGLEYFAVEAVARGVARGYSGASDTISLLGVGACGAGFCSPQHVLMNLGIILSGLTIFGGAVFSRPAWPQAPGPRVGLVLLGISGIGSAMAGLWPLDSNFSLHAAGAALTFAVGNLGMVLMARGLTRAQPVLAWLGIVGGVVALVAFALFVVGVDLGLGRGTIERIVAYPKILWLALAGAAVISATRHRRMKLAG